MKKNRLVLGSLACYALATVLMILPNGYISFSMPNPDEKILRKYSYFNTTSYGMGNLFPLYTAIMTCICIVLTLTLIFIFFEKLVNLKLIFNAIAITMAIISVVMSYKVTFIGVSIIIALIAPFTLQLINNIKKSSKKQKIK